MGNIRIENKVVGFDNTHVTCEAVCFDLERNFAIRTQIKRSIVGNSGRYSEDMCTIVGNAGNSIALRNAVFAVIDASVVKKIYDAAKQKITGDVSDESKLIARRTVVFEGFKSAYHTMKLTDDEIAKAVGKSQINHITADDIVTLIGFEKSMAAGEMTPESVFRPTNITGPAPKPPSDKSGERILKLISEAKTKEALEKFKKDATSEAARNAYDLKFKELTSVTKS